MDLSEITFEILNSPSALIDIEYITKANLLYKGGNELKKNLEMFLPEHLNESGESYNYRLKCFNYENYLRFNINSITSGLFENSVKISGSPYLEKVTEVNNLTNIMRDIATNNLLFGKSYIKLDFSDFEPENLYQQDLMGSNIPIISILDNCQVINYSIESGKFTQLLLKTIKIDDTISILDPCHFYIEFCYYQLTGKEVNLITWETERFELKDNAKKAGNWYLQYILKKNQISTDYKLLTPTIKTLNINYIPVLMFEFPKGIDLSGLITIAETILRNTSAFDAALARVMHPIPIMYLGPEYIKGSFNEATQSASRNMSPQQSLFEEGVSKLAQDDKVEYLEIKGDSLKLVKDYINDCVDAMHRLAYQVAQSISATKDSMDRSGTSKQVDEHLKDVLISTIATLLKLYLSNILDTILVTYSKNEKYEITGMDFNSEDLPRSSTVQEAIQLGSIIPILSQSETFKKIYSVNLADKLLNGQTDEINLIKIREEIMQAELPDPDQEDQNKEEDVKKEKLNADTK